MVRGRVLLTRSLVQEVNEIQLKICGLIAVFLGQSDRVTTAFLAFASHFLFCFAFCLLPSSLKNHPHLPNECCKLPRFHGMAGRKRSIVPLSVPLSFLAIPVGGALAVAMTVTTFPLKALTAGSGGTFSGTMPSRSMPHSPASCGCRLGESDGHRNGHQPAHRVWRLRAGTRNIGRLDNAAVQVCTSGLLHRRCVYFNRATYRHSRQYARCSRAWYNA